MQAVKSMTGINILSDNIGVPEYKIIHEKMLHVDLGEYYTYGIQSESGAVIRDISTIRETAEEMAALFNKCGLSPTHLKDAVEDMLGF